MFLILSSQAMKQEMISKQAARNKEINDFRTLSIKDKDEVHKLEVEERARVTSIKEEFANEISKDTETEQQMKAASLKANQLQLQAAGDAKRIAEEQLENPDKPASSVDTAAEMASDGSPGPADTPEDNAPAEAVTQDDAPTEAEDGSAEDTAPTGQ